MSALTVAFAGTPEFASEALRAILAASFRVPLVLTQPDRPAGRGMKLHASAVKQLAQSHQIEVAQPHSLRLDGAYPDEARAAREALMAAKPDVLVVAAYGLILPQWVLDLPRLGCLNIHGSLLPRWRGAAPIHRAIEAGDAQTGITIMQMDAGLDTGDMLISAGEPIRPDDTTATLHDRLAVLGGQLIVNALQLASGPSLTAKRQPEQGVTYAHKINKTEAAINWAEPAQTIARRVRAFDPFPGSTLQLANDKGMDTIKLWAASVVPAEGKPGEVLCAHGDDLVIACANQALSLHSLQRPGGKRISARDFLQTTRMPTTLT